MYTARKIGSMLSRQRLFELIIYLFCKNEKNGTGPMLKRSEFLSVVYPYFRYSVESNCQFGYMCSENEDVVMDVFAQFYRCVCRERFYRSGHTCRMSE